jgi:hypothetical protein
VSKRVRARPICEKALGALTVASAGAGSAAAAVASWPYVRRSPSPRTMAPFSARSSLAATPQCSAAAVMRRWRASAPARRSLSQPSRTLVLPPVTCVPSSVFVYCSPAGAASTRIDSTGTSSSSAISVGSDVYTPCPISDLSERKVMLPSVPMRSHAFGCTGASGSPSAGAVSGPSAQPGSCKAISRPPPAAAEVRKNSRLVLMRRLPRARPLA